MGVTVTEWRARIGGFNTHLVGVRRHYAAQLKSALKCALKQANNVIKNAQPEIVEILSDVLGNDSSEAHSAFKSSFLACFRVTFRTKFASTFKHAFSAIFKKTFGVTFKKAYKYETTVTCECSVHEAFSLSVKAAFKSLTR